MTEQKVAIASYNTSWLGDYGKMNDFASEKHMFVDLFKTETPRKYFENAINMALSFWNDPTLNAGAIGFQEMNIRNIVREQKGMEDFQGGTDYIKQIFGIEMNSSNSINTTITGRTKTNNRKILERKSDTPLGTAFGGSNQEKDIAFAEHYVEVSRPAQVPGLLTIWKPSIFGQLKYQYGSDLSFNILDKKQQGRPILIVLTDKNFVLINLHGPNFPEESNNNMQGLRNAIQEHLTQSFQQFNISNVPPHNIFIMGDFNDPYNAINHTNPLVLNKNNYSYGSAVVKSCCYNFNSSCPDELFGKTDTKDILKKYGYPFSGIINKIISNPKECILIGNDETNIKKVLDETISTYNIILDKKDEKDYLEEIKKLVDIISRKFKQGPGIGPSIEARSLGDRGKIENYRFTGDYVFGLDSKLVTPLQIYRNNTKKISEESDHEMVYAVFNIPTGTSFGGRRTKKKWSAKYKKSINCKKPKGFSQKQYCKYGRKTRKTI